MHPDRWVKLSNNMQKSKKIIWACSKFSDYILRQKVLIETDHKLLIPLLNTKHLHVLPPWILRFRLRLAKLHYTVFHVPGKLLYAADALSRAPIRETEDPLEVEAFVESITQFTCLQAETGSERRPKFESTHQNGGQQKVYFRRNRTILKRMREPHRLQQSSIL